MPTYVIEREIPGAGDFTQQDLQGISKTSCNVLSDLGSDIQWLHSYVTDNKIYCVYEATDEEIIRRHAELGGFPANSVAEVRNTIDPSTAAGAG